MSAPHWSEIDCEWNNLQCPEMPLCKTCLAAAELRKAVQQGAKLSFWQPTIVVVKP